MQLQTTSHTVEWLPYNQNNKCWWECRETRPTRPVCGNVKCHCRKQNRSCSKVLRSGIYGSHGNLFFNFFVPIFTATLYTIAKTWQPPKCPSISGCINRMCSLLMEWDIIHPEKAGNPGTCYNIDEPYRHYAKWTKWDQKKRNDE